MFFAKILGPTIGLGVGALLNKVYYNFKRTKNTSSFQKDYLSFQHRRD